MNKYYDYKCDRDIFGKCVKLCEVILCLYSNINTWSLWKGLWKYMILFLGDYDLGKLNVNMILYFIRFN